MRGREVVSHLFLHENFTFSFLGGGISMSTSARLPQNTQILSTADRVSQFHKMLISLSYSSSHSLFYWELDLFHTWDLSQITDQVITWNWLRFYWLLTLLFNRKVLETEKFIIFIANYIISICEFGKISCFLVY